MVAFLLFVDKVLPETLPTISTPTPAPTIVIPQRAPQSVVDWALGWRRSAIRQRALLTRARLCFNIHHYDPIAGRPLRSRTKEIWLQAGARWRSASQAFAERFHLLRYRMAHPGGGGALRWRPLVKWWWRGCSNAFAYTMVHIAWHESGGAEHRYNFGGSGAYGIWQLLPRPSWVWGADSQAKAAHMKYVAAGGFSPWSSCAAFSCSGSEME